MRLFAILFFCFCSSLHAQLPDRYKAIERTLSHRKDTALVNALNTLGWQYRRIDSGKAIRYSERAEQLSKKLHYWNGLAFSYKNLGMAHSVNGNASKAKFYLNKALQQFSELNNRGEAGNIHNLFGLLYWETGKYDSAIVSYDKALDQYRRCNDTEGVAIVYSNTGILYYEMGKLDQSLERYSKALDIAGQRNDMPTLASVHSNIGLIYNTLGDYRKALFHHFSALRYDQQLGSYSGEAKTYTNIGVCYYNKHLPDSSLFFHQKALKLYEKIGEKKGVSQSLLNIGSIHLDRKEFDPAEACYIRGLAIKRAIGDLLGETTALIFLGKLRVAEGKPDEAIPSLSDAYRKAYHLHSLRYQVESSLLLAEIHEKLGHQREAMGFYKIHTVASDSLLREQSSTKLTALLISFATKDKQQEIDTLQHKNKTVSGQKTMIAVTATLFTVIAGLCMLYFRNRHHREKLRLEAELMANKARLMTYTRELIAKNIDSVEELADTPEFIDPAGAIATVATEMHAETLNRLSGARLLTDEDWDEFKKLFVSVYPTFMLQLKERNHGITPAELRLAALIRLQLSSREIAAMLGISGESVKKARQRLRRRLNLRPEHDLDEFLVGNRK